MSRTLVDHGSFYEGPRWHDGRWWVSDFYRHVVLSFDVDGNDLREELRVDAMASGLGWRPDGTLLVVSMRDHRLLRRRLDGVVETVASFGEIPAPNGLGVFACMLGGPAGRTLLQCCAPGYLAHQREHADDAILVATDVDIGRAGLP